MWHHIEELSSDKKVLSEKREFEIGFDVRISTGIDVRDV